MNVPDGVAWGTAGGVAATMVMDVVMTIGRRAGYLAGVPPQSIGRWFAYGFRGRFTHADIAAEPPARGELPMAGVGHYAIGAVLGGAFGALFGGLPTVLSRAVSAALFGVATSVFAWFVMFPAMGYGVFGARGPRPLKLFRTSLASHAAYGLGLALWALFTTRP